MKSQLSIEGTESGVTNGGSKEVIMTVDNKGKMKGWDVIVMRFLALVLSMAAVAVIGVNKQTVMVPSLNIQVTAKYNDSSANVYFVVANSIACSYAAISLFLTLANMGGNKRVSMMIILFDLAMVALLFSSIGAALAVGLLGYKGNTKVQWRKVCTGFERLCNQGMIGFSLSGGATALFFLLVVLAILTLHKKY